MLCLLAQRKVDDEAEIVDIMTIEKIGAFSSDSENELFYLPTVRGDISHLHQL